MYPSTFQREIKYRFICIFISVSHLYFALIGDDECSASLGSARAADDDHRRRISDATFIGARAVQFSPVQQQLQRLVRPVQEGTWKRNVNGVCDDPLLVHTFVDIATTIKHQSGMEGILTNIQSAPEGFVCLLYPMNNTEDFENGNFMDGTQPFS